MTWIELLAVILGPTGIVASIIKLLMMRSRKRHQLTDGIASINAIFTAIQQLLHATKAVRVLVLKSENGGGVPSPGCVVRSSVLYEACDPDYQRISPVWQQIELDPDYSSILNDVLSRGTASFVDDDATKQGLLVDLMRVGATKKITFRRICSTSRWAIYMAVCYYTAEEIVPHHRLEIRRVANDLCTIFQNHHTLAQKVADDT